MAQLVVSAEDRALLLPSVVARRLGVSLQREAEAAKQQLCALMGEHEKALVDDAEREAVRA